MAEGCGCSASNVILRGWWGNPWGFEFPLRHQMQNHGVADASVAPFLFVWAFAGRKLAGGTLRRLIRIIRCWTTGAILW